LWKASAEFSPYLSLVDCYIHLYRYLSYNGTLYSRCTRNRKTWAYSPNILLRPDINRPLARVGAEIFHRHKYFATTTGMESSEPAELPLAPPFEPQPLRISTDALCSYVPATIIRYLSSQALSLRYQAPFRHSFETVVVFADISGYTALSEKLASKGREGSEQLAKVLNSYVEQLVRVVASMGGDVFKFAGDALLVLWPESDENLCTKTRRAVQSALEIQRNMHNANMQEDVLSRMEYLATGTPLIQAFTSEHKVSN
jgi:hypothetical protein